jgi:hypothetical protein
VIELNKILHDLELSMHWDGKSWPFIKWYLSNHGDPNLLNQFKLPKDIQIANHKGKVLKDHDVFQSRWKGHHSHPNPFRYQNEQIPTFSSSVNVWELSHTERQCLLQEWNDDYYHILLTDFLELCISTERVANNMFELSQVC